MRAFVLEDSPERTKEFKKRFDKRFWDYVMVPDVASALKPLSTIEFDILFLDHDLGGEVYVDVMNKNTGSEIARWISENGLKGDPIIIIHSLNPSGQSYMKSLLPNATVIPFVWVEDLFERIIKEKET